VNNCNEFNKIMKDLDSFKVKIDNQLSIQESELSKKKIDIEESRLLLNDIEYNKLVAEFNKQAKVFENKIVQYENIIQTNIENNKNIILKEISSIIMKISNEQNYILIVNEDQYFLASKDIDISEIVLNELNKTNLKLKINNDILIK